MTVDHKASFFTQSFQKQVKYFNKKINVPLKEIRGVKSGYHDFAFSVSNITKADVLADTRTLVEQAIAEGKSPNDFAEDFQGLMAQKGWAREPEAQIPPRRLRTILDTNHRRSYGAGARQQRLALRSQLPYWQWIWRDSVQPRPHHKAINGKVFLASSEFFKHVGEHHGFGCRCTIHAMSENELELLGLTVEEPPDWRLFKEPGFDRPAGFAGKKTMRSYLKSAIDRQPKPLQRKIKADLRREGININ